MKSTLRFLLLISFIISACVPPATSVIEPLVSKTAKPTSEKLQQPLDERHPEEPPENQSARPTDSVSTKSHGGQSTETTTDSFTYNNMNNVLPEDVLKEILVFGMGGGDDCNASYSVPFVISDPHDTELMLETEFTTCGWRASSVLSATIIYPNGNIRYVSITTDERGFGKLTFRPSLSDPEGVYIFQITNGKDTLESNVYFRIPIVQRAYYLSDVQLLLHNFKPDEEIRLVAYNCLERSKNNCISFEFFGWKEYRVTSTGDLLIDFRLNLAFLAITSSGIQIPALPDKGISTAVTTRQSNLNSSEYQEYLTKLRGHWDCVDSTLTRIRLSGYPPSANVVPLINISLKVYANPRADARVKHKIDLGEEIRIFGDPICENERVWWRSSLGGYVMEFDGEHYYLEQIN